MANTEPIQKDGSRIWVAAIHDWTKDNCHQYMAKHDLRRNEVVDLIHKSGECLCGAFAKKGELAELELWFPKEAEMIHELEAKVRANGLPWGWEEMPPKWWMDKKDGQSHLFDMAALHPQSSLCWSCSKREE